MSVMRYSTMFLVVAGLCFAAVVAATASGALLPDRTYGIDDDGTTVSLKKGEALRVILPENPTTGYSWDLSLSDGLYLVSDRYIADDTGSRRVGAGGIHIWDIRARGIGPQHINAVYRRPWETNAAPEKTFDLKVRVTGGGGLKSDEDGWWRLPQMFRLSMLTKFPRAMQMVN
ncbi:protease inhibitor I42 family protein [Methanocella arvoryzae]|uniref:Proteinase inhibitor I42 chagasin domain-containing protein n=1 Tax=Methanocella arvoryzae (strain DSM 22066 / NBRC 105507 / MRE50) TaxID=351160 RepID=Q0W8P4_METAR|nr:protease inhibitor I42 family protein [Methanocella arvoryzae]CAJ35249.1 conserved hypothetical protein [Methanocella arvoryzae MRE50]